MAHALSQPVPTHHGNVGEAAVRDWLTAFLPKRFGVTSGHIRKQGFADSHVTSHFDVIVYDQIEAPVLWIESNPDKSPGGLSRIIPAENVRAVIEVKASLSNESAKAAVAKLSHGVLEIDDRGNRRAIAFVKHTLRALSDRKDTC